jgi:hypothetical protein
VPLNAQHPVCGTLGIIQQAPIPFESNKGMNKNLLKYLLLFSFFGCSPRVITDITPDISSKEARGIVWPHQFRNGTDTTEILEFRGVNLFYYSRGNRMYGWSKALGFYDFKGDTIILTPMSDKELYEHSKFDSSGDVNSLLRVRREEQVENTSKEELLLDKLLSKEFDVISKEDVEAWYKRYRRISSIPRMSPREANLDGIVWILKDRKSILKVSKFKNSTDNFHRVQKESKKRWSFW